MLKRNYAFFRLLSLISFLLTACNVYVPPILTRNQIPLEWKSHQQLLSVLNYYQFYGVIGYLSNRQKFYARLHWKQVNANNYRVILKNLIGKTEMDLSIKPGITKLINNQGKCYTSNSPEVIIQSLTNLSTPPFNELKQWMLGLPGDATDFTFDSHGHLNTLSYNYKGKLWTVTYHSYHNDTFPVLPSNIEFLQEDICIKLRIDSWNL